MAKKRAPNAKKRPQQRKPAQREPRRRGPTREERLAEARRARRRRQIRTRVLLVAVVVTVIGGIAFRVVVNRRNAQRVISALEAGPCDYDTRSDPGRDDLRTPPTYEVDPPAGGVHALSPARPGAFPAGRAPADAEIVHALEHGLIAIWYRPDLSDTTVTQLRSLSDRYPEDVIVASRQSLSVPVAATAWHRRLLCAEVDRRAVTRFITAYRGDGPEQVP